MTTRKKSVPPEAARTSKKDEDETGAAGPVLEPKKQQELAHERNRLRYFEAKRAVLVREKKNYTQLIFVKSSNGWFKAFSHSAVIFVQQIAPKIGSKTRLMEDKDYEVRSDVSASVPDMEKLIEKLKEIGIELVERDDRVYTFALGYRVPTDEYNLMREQNQTIVERTGKMSLPTVLMPNLLANIRELFQTTFWEVRSMDGAIRILIGEELVGIARGMVEKYVVMSRDSRADVAEYLKGAIEDIEAYNGVYYALDGLRIVNEKKMFEIAMQISEVRKQIIYEMKRHKAKEIEVEHNGKVK